MAAADESAKERGRRVTGLLVSHGRALGFDVETEVPVHGGRLDVVWFAKALPLPGAEEPLPLVAFEIESSWRTRKHIKGDYMNLFDSGASLGVLVLLGAGEEVESTRRFARSLTDRPGPRIVTWSDEDVDRLLTTPSTSAERGSARPPMSATTPTRTLDPPVSRDHAGKYHSLWRWLNAQPPDRLEVTFEEIEEVIGMRLPPSSRRHAAHWHSYDGSAVVRAIHDAGWKVRDLKLSDGRVTLERMRVGRP